jgi:hypothetical protein
MAQRQLSGEGVWKRAQRSALQLIQAFLGVSGSNGVLGFSTGFMAVLTATRHIPAVLGSVSG